ncbi:hypothetical protein CR513_13356, partial [Mucuna pruriens]
MEEKSRDPKPEVGAAFHSNKYKKIKMDYKASKIFELIHCDLWRRYHTQSHNGSHYFLTVVDYYSRVVWIYLLREKSKIAGYLINFCKMVMQSDYATKFVNSQIITFFHDEGILCGNSCVNSPQQNGCEGCTLTVVHLINRTPTIANYKVTPYEMLYKKPSSYKHLRVATQCIFVRYPQGQKGWQVYNPCTQEFSVSRDVRFYEDMFPYSQHEGSSVTIFQTLFRYTNFQNLF